MRLRKARIVLFFSFVAVYAFGGLAAVVGLIVHALTGSWAALPYLEVAVVLPILYFVVVASCDEARLGLLLGRGTES